MIRNKSQHAMVFMEQEVTNMDVFNDLLSIVLVYVTENVKYSKQDHLLVDFSMFQLFISQCNVMPTKITRKIKPKNTNRHNTLNMHSVCVYHALVSTQR